jgi:hypothetical protein
MRHTAALSKRGVAIAAEYQVPLDAKLAFSQDVLNLVIPVVANKDPRNPLAPSSSTTTSTTTTTTT